MVLFKKKLPLSVMKAILRIRRLENDFPLEELRDLIKKWRRASIKFPIAPDIQIDRLEIEGLETAHIYIKNAQHRGTMLYLHGGGYTFGSIETHKELVSRLVRAGNVDAWVVNYRLAPEFPCPAAVKDSIKAYRFLLAKNIDPKNIVIAGDSAGGGLTISALVQIREQSLPMPACAFCLSPWADLTNSGESAYINNKVDPMLTLTMLNRVARLYVPDGHLDNPLASPLFADLKGLPPLLIQVGTVEVLLDDARRLAEKAEQAGVNVTLEVWEGMTHVWQVLGNLIEEAQYAVEHIATFLDKHLN